MSLLSLTQIQERQTARAQVLVKMADETAPPLSEDDVKLMTPQETVRAVNAGRIPGIGRDKRLRQR
jgi:hypothetical protein